MMYVPNKEAFQLTKISIPKKGGLKLEYGYTRSIRDESHEESDKKESSIDPHPDLSAILRSMKDYFLQVTYLGMFGKVVNRDQFKATASQKKIAESTMDEIKRYIRITGITLSGKDENFAVQISASIEAVTGQGMALTTHRIRLEDETYGFEGELSDKIEDLNSEAYEFLFNEKMAEPDMFSNSIEQPGEETEEEAND